MNRDESFIPLIDEIIVDYPYLDSKDDIHWFYSTENEKNGKVVSLQIKNGSFVWNDVVPEKAESIRGVNLINNSKFVISDSGGIQEESSILRKPLLIPRNYTERQEMLKKFNLLTQTPENLLHESTKLLKNESELITNIKNSDLLYGKDEVIPKIVKEINA